MSQIWIREQRNSLGMSWRALPQMFGAACCRFQRSLPPRPILDPLPSPQVPLYGSGWTTRITKMGSGSMRPQADWLVRLGFLQEQERLFNLQKPLWLPTHPIQDW